MINPIIHIFLIATFPGYSSNAAISLPMDTMQHCMNAKNQIKEATAREYPGDGKDIFCIDSYVRSLILPLEKNHER
jgi:hypothetical protein